MLEIENLKMRERFIIRAVAAPLMVVALADISKLIGKFFIKIEGIICVNKDNEASTKATNSSYIFYLIKTLSCTIF